MNLPAGRLIGMVHLGALPGAPGFAGDLDAVVEAAVADAGILEDAGYDAVLVENFGDSPFFADDVEKVTVAAMTRAVSAIRASIGLPIGVNVLRNDALAALAIAAATGAAFIRVNVLSGSMATDQGAITGKAALVARRRASIAPGVQILADVFVKHATPPPGLSFAAAAQDAWERGGADALVVSGAATGQPAAITDLVTVRAAVPAAPIYLGSGAAQDTVADLLTIADAAIVGTAIKRDGSTTAPVDPARAKAFVAAANA